MICEKEGIMANVKSLTRQEEMGSNGQVEV